MSTVSPPPPRKRRRISASTSSPASTTATTPTTPSIPESPPSPPPDHWLRIYSWNINGIQPFLQPSIGAFLKPARPTVPRADAPITTSLRNFLRRHHWPQLVLLQEVKINPNDEHTKRSVENAVNLCRSGADEGPRYQVRFCLPSDRYNATGFHRKIHGVCTIIRTDFLPHITRIRTVPWDREGRILILETTTRLSIWNVYAPNGTTNPYRSPVDGSPAGTRHDRKLAFHAAMAAECAELESKGRRVVVGGDLNVASREIDGFPGLRKWPEQHVRNRADFNARFLGGKGDGGLGLVDTFRHLHPKRKKYSWLPRHVEWRESCDRIDYFFVSKSLEEMGAVREADVEMSVEGRGPSDHCPVWVGLDVPD